MLTNKQLVIICASIVVCVALALGYSIDQVVALIRVVALCLGVAF